MLSSPRRTRIPLTADYLHRLYQVLVLGGNKPPPATLQNAMLWAAVCMGFFGALRCGEFTCKSPSSFNHKDNLCIGDITFGWDSKLQRSLATLHLKASKTDPFREGCDIILFATGHSLCPVSALKSYLAKAPAPPDAPLFRLASGAPLCRSTFASLLSEALLACGIPASLTMAITPHSLRKGFATSASAARLEDHVISALGRWSSQCYKTYITTPRAVIARAHSALAHPRLIGECNDLRL